LRLNKAQLLHRIAKVNVITNLQQDNLKSTNAKSACKMMVKLTLGRKICMLDVSHKLGRNFIQYLFLLSSFAANGDGTFKLETFRNLLFESSKQYFWDSWRCGQNQSSKLISFLNP